MRAARCETKRASVTRPARRIAITLGDVCGIGPEVILKALAKRKDLLRRSLLIGDPGSVKKALYRYRLTRQVRIMVIGRPEEARQWPGALVVLSYPHAGLSRLPLGRESALAGRMAAVWLRRGVELILKGQAGALVTGPVNKAAVARAHPDFRGQTEFVARAARVRDPVMMLAGPTLRVVPVTRHMPLRRALAVLSPSLICGTVLTTAKGLKRWVGIRNPRIGVCGVNPHAGEGGLLGGEDRRIVAPAVARAKRRGVKTSGPLPADTAFCAARQGKYDAVVAMYHDQAMIPVKTVELERTVNATLGLPFLRTSPAHGTAFDIAGRGIADPASMRAAIEMAAAAARGRR